MQFDEAIDSVLAELRRRNLMRVTVARYRDVLTYFAKRVADQGITDVRQVRRADIEAHQGHLFDRGYKPYTVAQHMSALRRLFEHLNETGHLLLDPMEGIKALRVEQPLPRRIVSEEEMRKLLTAPTSACAPASVTEL